MGAQTHGMWLGSYERDVQAALCREVKPGHVFFDVGANVGFYTVIASRLVGSGRVIAFEPLPGNLDILRRHIATNHLSNVTIVPKALADSVGKARFSTTNDCSMNRLDPGGELEVEATTVDGALAARGNPPPDVLKVDVEGAELAMLRGATACLRTYRPLLLVQFTRIASTQACTASSGTRTCPVRGDDPLRRGGTRRPLCRGNRPSATRAMSSFHTAPRSAPRGLRGRVRKCGSSGSSSGTAGSLCRPTGSPGSRVLDVGAGPCRHRRLFDHCDYRSQDFCQHEGATGGPMAEGEGWRYGRIDYVSDATAIPVADRSFDAVLCTEMLEHVPEPARVVEEIARI